MARHVELPPSSQVTSDGSCPAGWWHEEDGKVVCDLCPRGCRLGEGQRGFCFVRQNRNGEMVLTTYGRSTGFCIDPIEKKPLNHFFPGTSVLSFGTAGCNLACKFCQNWSISKSREIERLSEAASPMAIARAAQTLGCTSVAYTYNDPVIFAEYAVDTAKACREYGIKNVAVTAGYILPPAREYFFQFMDAANVDLKAFSERFYRELCSAQLQPVLDTLKYLVEKTSVWLEITNLIIPQENDDPGEIREMCRWIVNELGPDVPVHFTAFHPDYRLVDRSPTPAEKLIEAYEIARDVGLHYVYTGNVLDIARQSTYCPQCKQVIIERNGYWIGRYGLQGNRCRFCGSEIAGRFSPESAPGTWGPRRCPVRISDYA